MSSERLRFRLSDIVENADRIADYIAGLDPDGFATSLITVDAVERCLARITEAIVQIGEADTMASGLGVPWAEVRALGNRLRHEYRRIDARIIYDTATGDVPPLRDAAARALER